MRFPLVVIVKIQYIPDRPIPGDHLVDINLLPTSKAVKKKRLPLTFCEQTREICYLPQRAIDRDRVTWIFSKRSLSAIDFINGVALQ